jgi:uncharacterized protein YecT (DUF1311 family)
MIPRSLSILLALTLPATADAHELRFDPAPTADCVAAGGEEACIGRAADACMAQPGGGTTVGMGFCADRERGWWDARLNAVYGQLMALEKALDSEMAEIGATVPPRAEALRAMQRAWIPFRDAACDYERAQWGGGTGGGPATYLCLMHQTARQTLLLERYRGQDSNR